MTKARAGWWRRTCSSMLWIAQYMYLSFGKLLLRRIAS